MLQTMIDAAAMGGLALVSVGLWTLRVSLTARDRKALAALAAGLEAVVFALVFAEVLTGLDAPARLTGYALGVGVGALVGMHASDRLARGQSELRIVADHDGDAIAAGLRARGWPATAVSADSATGPALVMFVAVDDARLPDVVGDVERLAPDAFWTVEPLRQVRPTALPQGLVQVRGSGQRGARPPQGPASLRTMRSAQTRVTPARRQLGPAVKRS